MTGTVQFGTTFPIIDGEVTTDYDTYKVEDILGDEDVYFDFVGSLGGPDFGLDWPGGDFGYHAHVGFTHDRAYLMVVIETDLPVDDYYRMVNP